MLGLQPTIGDNLIMPSFIAIIVGGLGSLPGTLAGRLADRRRLRRHQRVLPLGERGGDLRDDGRGADRPAARPARRGRPLLMTALDKRAADVLIWLLLLTRALLAAADRRLYRAREPRR